MTQFRWVICALLFFATTINYMDRQILALLKPALDGELGWTNEQYGMINSIFTFFYGAGLLGFGWLIDRIGTKAGYALSITGWSLAAAGHGLVSSVGGFGIARSFLGLSEAGNFPAAITVVAQWFPKRERAFATSLFNAGANVGAMLAPALVPPIAGRFGWRAAFVAAGIAGFLWLFLWFPLFSRPEKSKCVNAAELAHIEEGVDAAVHKIKVPWLSLLGYRQTWGVLVLRIFTDPVWWFFLIWLPDFFQKARGLDIKGSWYYLTTIYAVVTLLSIFAGWITGKLMHMGWSVTRARKTVMLICALCVVPILCVTRLDGWISPWFKNPAAATDVVNWSIVAVIGLAGAAHQAWSANAFTTVSDIYPQQAVGSMTGLGGMAGCVSSIIFPLVCGRVLDHYKGHGNIGYGILFGICAFAYVVAFILNHLIIPKFEPLTLKKLVA